MICVTSRAGERKNYELTQRPRRRGETQNKQPFLRELCACSALSVLIFALSCRARMRRLSAVAERVIRNVGKG